jgi:hypothetical protein
MPLDLHTLLLAASVVVVLLLARRILTGRARHRTTGPPAVGALATGAPAPEDARHPPASRPESASDAGGWRGLAARWPAAGPAAHPIARRATVAFGAVRWKNCVVVGMDPEGLLLAVRIPLLGSLGTRPAAVPWEAIGEPRPARLYGSAAVLLPLGDPPIEMIVPLALWRRILDARAALAAAGTSVSP